MAKQRKTSSARRPPLLSKDHSEIEHWISGMRPDLVPIVESLDAQIREGIPGLEYALKWKRGFFGLPDLGWVVELVAYSLSVNVVFLGGADFESPPPLGDTGRSRYVKVRTLEQAQAAEMTTWIEQAAGVSGWK